MYHAQHTRTPSAIGHTARVHLYGDRFATGQIIAVASDAQTGERVYVMAHRDSWPDSCAPDLIVWLVPASSLVTMPEAVSA